jgi:hypothetical protein
MSGSCMPRCLVLLGLLALLTYLFLASNNLVWCCSWTRNPACLFPAGGVAGLLALLTYLFLASNNLV